MKKYLFSVLFFCAVHNNTHAQPVGPDAQAAAITGTHTSSVAALAGYIQQNFSTDSARVRAVYVWIGHHISYDLQRMQAVQQNRELPPQSAADVLQTRKAVCQGYVDLFVALCRSMGINATMVGGYTKIGGKVASIPHAWAAVQMAGEWFLFDPTWAAGYVKEGRFVNNFNTNFYKAAPEKFVADHMPFDPMYQMLHYPLTHREFIESSKPAGKVRFHFKDTLAHYNRLSQTQQLAAELRRMEGAGVVNDFLLQRQQYLQKNLQAHTAVDAFDQSIQAFNNAVALYNSYIGHKNKQFSTISENELQQMTNGMAEQLSNSRSLLLTVEPRNDGQRQNKAASMGSIEKLWLLVQKEQEFVARYVAADAPARKQLFIRR